MQYYSSKFWIIIGWKTIGNFLSQRYHPKMLKKFLIKNVEVFLNDKKLAARSGCIKTSLLPLTIHRRPTKQYKKYQHHQNYITLVECVEDVVWRREHTCSFGNQGTITGWTEQITREMLHWSERKIWSSGTSSTQFFSGL